MESNRVRPDGDGNTRSERTASSRIATRILRVRPSPEVTSVTLGSEAEAKPRMRHRESDVH